MIFRQLFDATSGTYTYLLAPRGGGGALLIDPVLDQLPAYLQLLRELNLKLELAVDTHVHADHITALGRLQEETGCVTVIGAQARTECATRRVSDGEVLEVGSLRLRAIYTPGHTDDSYCFVVDDLPEKILFSGDTLLIRGTGRTDFQNGNAAAAYHSLFHKLLKLPDETRVYPGHDYKGWTTSTIGEERRHNPRLQVQNEAEYVALMAALKLPNPRQMDIAVPANLACGRV